ncbi:MAG TPA: ABC transporter permease [Thermoplasmata archaeon]|nr:ABC transporter permease [Thermoplasmata archaeon]
MSGETPAATILPSRVADAPVPQAAAGGQWSQFVGLYARELIRTFRNKFVLLVTVVQPFMWLAFFGSSFSGVPLPVLDTLLRTHLSSYLQFLLPGVLSTSMLSIGMFGSMSTIQDKRFGFMKRILLTPTSKATVYLTKALGSATRGLVQVPVMIAAALLFGVRLNGDPLEWAGWILGLVFLGLGFSCLFLAVTASSTDWQTPGVISNFITMPLMFASGALFPQQNFPSWMQAIANVNPVTYSALFGRGILVDGTADWLYLGYLAVFAAVMLGIGTWVASRYLKVE